MSKIDPANLSYFLMRQLISKDVSNQFGKKTQKLSQLENALKLCINSEPTALIEELILNNKSLLWSKANSNVEYRLANFREFLRRNITDHETLKIFKFTISSLMPLVNSAIENVRTDHAQILAKDHAKEILKVDGDAALERIINEWDDITLHECLSVENNLAADLIADINLKIDSSNDQNISKHRKNLVSAGLQEFERRTLQKRKQRSGEDLHYATMTILEHLGISHDPAPSLITGVIEADLSLKAKAGWKVLVSCKRTGRERVKQATTTLHELNSNRIHKMVWFFTHFDQSENRVQDMGVRGNIFYLPDSSRAYKDLSKNPLVAEYVLPISTIRDTLRKIIDRKL